MMQACEIVFTEEGENEKELTLGLAGHISGVDVDVHAQYSQWRIVGRFESSHSCKQIIIIIIMTLLL